MGVVQLPADLARTVRGLASRISALERRMSQRRPQTQQVRGPNSVWSGNFVSPGYAPLSLQVTPTVDSWWLVDAHAIVRVLDPAWYVLEATLTLDAAGADGVQTARGATEHHNGAAAYSGVHVAGRFLVPAGETRTCTLTLVPAAGTWNVFLGPDYMNLRGLLVPA